LLGVPPNDEGPPASSIGLITRRAWLASRMTWGRFIPPLAANSIAASSFIRSSQPVSPAMIGWMLPGPGPTQTASWAIASRLAKMSWLLAMVSSSSQRLKPSRLVCPSLEEALTPWPLALKTRAFCAAPTEAAPAMAASAAALVICSKLFMVGPVLLQSCPASGVRSNPDGRLGRPAPGGGSPPGTPARAGASARPASALCRLSPASDR
jgi:hypothetical protein